jgi:hypothetical protein
MDLPLLSIPEAHRELPTSSWPYAGGVILWRDVIDFFDDMPWLKGMIEEKIRSRFEVTKENGLKIERVNLEAMALEANYIQLQLEVSNLKTFVKHVDQGWYTNLVTTTLTIPEKVSFDLTMSLNITGSGDSQEFRMALKEIKIKTEGSVVGNLSTWGLQFFKGLADLFFGSNGYPILAKSSHWLFQPYQKSEQKSESDKLKEMRDSYVEMTKKLDIAQDNTVIAKINKMIDGERHERKAGAESQEDWRLVNA